MMRKKTLTTTDKPRAIGYVRISTETQAKEGESLDRAQEHPAKSRRWRDFLPQSIPL